MPAIENTHILLVEDSEDDLFFFRRLLAKAGVKSPVDVATDGQQAIDHLSQAISGNGGAHPPVPRLIFLDLKLPLRGGFEVLDWIRAQAALAHVVVVVLSSSAETRDVVQAFKLGAQGYLVKYPEPAVFHEVVSKIAALPPDADPRKVLLPGLPRP
jgi:CheY-like chemotaxis protein